MWELEQQVEELVNKYLEESGAVLVSADKLGLDRRSGSIYVLLDEDCIAVKGSVGSLNYYGGFEYIKEEYITTIGHITFYSGETSRVEDCIRYYIENTENNNQEQEGEAS